MKRKLSISELKVESFITKPRYIKGGIYPEPSHGAAICGTEDVTCEGAGCADVPWG